MKKVVFTAGGFDPLHVGHIEMIRQSAEIGDILIVSVAKDKHIIDKKGYVFMKEDERAEIIYNIKGVDRVIYHEGEDGTVIGNIKKLKKFADEEGYELVFTKGGDRFKDEIPEREICEELGIEIVDGLGEKIQSSTNLIEELRGKDEYGNEI